MQLCASCFTRCAWLLGPAASMIWDLSVLHLPLLVCSFAYDPLLATKTANKGPAVSRDHDHHVHIEQPPEF